MFNIKRSSQCQGDDMSKCIAFYSYRVMLNRTFVIMSYSVSYLLLANNINKSVRQFRLNIYAGSSNHICHQNPQLMCLKTVSGDRITAFDGD